MQIDDKLEELVADLADGRNMPDARAWEILLCHVACALPFNMTEAEYIEVLHRWRAFVANELAERRSSKLH
jgi:hypothetical protein